MNEDKKYEAFEGELVPAKDGEEMIGCVTCTYSVDIKKRMSEAANQFQDSVTAIDGSIREVIDGIESLFHMLKGNGQDGKWR